ncbi:crosslink repair DNA glycosylase YcaQ family protein [Arthrobacter sp. APC 3897]|uniref:DNA glycosylase AlkZ-like family protein n=1 Tax=Arthrobacter sp. APC 3897 TaxID=3035204 RepID=UPI0025B4FBFC|nr:crosslink repair DNA glycosylase YcaQ family protein [Arthrobacter sp. APC 3897]MDN3482164.1 crosslink repair DNA glycosylase YcaQ family protein [Arthrobacter sp. APC 3897]
MTSGASVLQKFTPATREWFEGAFDAPTPAQTGAWDAISQGANALVVAPTGSGKTLAAFLWALDSFIASAAADKSSADPAAAGAPVSEPAAASALSGHVTKAPARKRNTAPKRKTKVLYISPLKALGVDVERNLRSPLIGITQTAKRLGLPAPSITVGVRSGDTPQNERRTLLTRPPDILITTPESLFLMLTSRARETLAEVDTVIVDEVHAVAGTKRGAHLAVTLARLDAMLPKPVQRIGLSATVEPHETVARFLGGNAPVQVVAPEARKSWDITVTVPVEDMADLGGAPAVEDTVEGGYAPQASIWPHVEERIVDLIETNRSTIVFANSRRLAERLTARLNEIHAFRLEAAALSLSSADTGTEGSTTAGDGPPSFTTGDGPGPAAGAAGPALPTARPPAQLMAQAGVSIRYRQPDQVAVDDDNPVLARAHHGSVSKDQRALIEDDLKSGRLRCVVATSSLELGIDMGAVDLVIQVESPPSVASGLQRVGRAGHQVGETSQGVMFPKHRGDLLNTAVVAERMLAGQIEPLYIPANPLDILAQQTVAASALGSIDVEEWFDVVRRSAPFAGLPRSAFDATLDLLAGRYPSDEFAELRPRIVWDRTEGTITGRPGAQRLAVTSGGTIPDRGLFGVYLVGDSEGKNSRRVGELDEEMVYESRVGDVFALGATSWRIEDITHDRVLVSPAFGQPGKLPFWRGDSLGRPVELGRALGGFVREMSGADDETAAKRLAAVGLDDWAAGNLLTYLREQQQATDVVPNDKSLVVERFHDELGDWRVVLHSPYGMPVHAPWALAVGARLHQRYGLDGSAMASDDGIVLRVPLMEDEPPGAELFIFDADELDSIVTAEVGGSALFASRFRECAARALLLPRQNPGKRTPLWQQRQRSAQLLDVAKKYPTFPIVLETVRECLQDVYDLPALKDIAGGIERREIRLVETTTPSPSPFARSLLFGYVGAFLYEGDSPLAERRAAALSLDPTLLNELLGRAELRELLDARIIAQTERELQRLADDRRVRGIEGVADLLRLLGPLTVPEVAARLQPGDADQTESTAGTLSAGEHDALELLEQLVRANRALKVGVAGQQRYAAIEDAARLRDALGVPLPMGVPLAFIEPVADPLGDLIGRYARTHGPFTAAEAAARLGLGVAVVTTTLQRLAGEGRVIEGEFRPSETMILDAAAGVDQTPGSVITVPGTPAGTEWCDVEVLRRLRRRSLAALRSEVEPVDPATYARFLPAWQNVGSSLRGLDGVATVIDQLSGVPIPASAWEPLILGSRIRNYVPSMLDELTATGEVLWSGTGSLPGNDGWIALHLAENAPLTLNPAPDFVPTDQQQQLLDLLSGGGAYFFRQLVDGLAANGAESSDANVISALWELVWAGRISNDTFTPIRSLLSGGKTAHKQRAATPRARTARLGRLGRAPGASLTGSSMRLAAGNQPAALRNAPPLVAGRWSLLPGVEQDTTISAHATAELLLDRYGVVTRGSVASEGTPGGFALLYRVLARLEEMGRCRRGYFIEQLGAAQFAVPATVDRLRSFSEDSQLRKPDPSAVALAATDPANPFGAALPWPTLDGGHRPGRKAGALVVLVDGNLTLYAERGGKTLLTFTEDPAALELSASALVDIIRRGAAEKMAIEKVNGGDVLDTEAARALMKAGFYTTPKGLRYRV